MGDQDVRVPKGILKNKYASSSSSREEIPDKISYGASASYGHGAGGASSGWERDPRSQMGMMGGGHAQQMPVAPMSLPQHGMNMPNPVLDPVIRGIKSEFQSPTNQKLLEFVNKKRESLFRPLDPDETPISEVKGTQQNTEDHYGVVPSFDHFLGVEASEVKQYFFQNARIGDIVIGRVLSSSVTRLYIRLLCCEGGKNMILEDLNLRAFCPSTQTTPVADIRDPSRYYDIDDLVRLELLEVHKDTGRLIAGMKGTTLSAEMQHSFQLGMIARKDLPRYYELSKNKNDSNDPRGKQTYQEMLKESPGFHNPNNITHLASNLGIYNNSNSLMRGIRSGFPAHEKSSPIRQRQNAVWAHGHVGEGIKYFKLAKFTEAFQSLNSALLIDGNNVEALVTRGALYAHNGNYEKAIDDFESALKFNPHHFNAKKYLAETLTALGRQQESNEKLEDAIASYSKSLVVKADHKDAKEALWSLHTRTEKLDPLKLVGSAAVKAAELKAKLKTILQSDLGDKMEAKSTKEKKSKKDRKKRDSSGSEDDSSSSDESSSDSSSSGSGHKKRSKKRKKKKSKKGKKTRKEVVSDKKPRELSLSPFAKRLAEPGGGMPSSGSGYSGFTNRTYAELQLGITKPDRDKDDSDEEGSKQSSKKGKDKKRSKKSKEKKKKKKHVTDSSSSDTEAERSKKKSKKQSEEIPLQSIIPELGILGDLEAKLSAYYSKIEQGKIETLPASRRSRSRSRSRGRERGRERERSRSPVLKKRPREYDDVPPRIIENVPPPRVAIPSRTDDEIKSWSERKSGTIDLQTDDYGNIVQSQNIVCTVKNDIPPPVAEPSKASKFEMKFKPLSDSAVKGENGTSASVVPAAPEGGSKWRPLGVAAPPSEAMRNAFERESSPRSDADRKNEKDRNSKDHKPYRKRSRSSSGSPARRRRRSRSRSFSRSPRRSHSRSRSRSYSKSRSRSPSRRDRRPYQAGYRGRAPVRFFRGYNYTRGGRGGRPYNTRPYGGRDRDYGGGSGGGRSKFRNRFSHTPSRSRSRSRSRDRRSRSRSVSPRDRRRKGRSRSPDRVRRSPVHRRGDRDPYVPSQETASSGRMEADSLSQPQEEDRSKGADEIHIGGLRTASAADLEELLDKRNAEKKEEMRKSNPEFFRP